MPAVFQSNLVEGAFHTEIALIHGQNRHPAGRSVVRGAGTRFLDSLLYSLQQEHTMLGDYSSINDHLDTARKHADQAETEAKPELYREAIDELVAAIRLLMRNSNEKDS